MLGSRLSLRFSVRTIVRAGLVVAAAAVLVLLAVIEPELQRPEFGLSMALLGVGMGLLASQLGNVVQSSVDASGRSEAGGLQYTGQHLGSSLGVAFAGAIVLAGLTSNFIANIESDERISDQVAAQVTVAVGGGVDFVSTDQIAAAATEAGLDQPTVDAIVDDYAEAQLRALKTGLLATAAIALLSLLFTARLPSRRPGVAGQAPAPEAVGGAGAVT